MKTRYLTTGEAKMHEETRLSDVLLRVDIVSENQARYNYYSTRGEYRKSICGVDVFQGEVELILNGCVAETEEEVGDVLEAVRLATEQFRSLATSQGDGA